MKWQSQKTDLEIQFLSWPPFETRREYSVERSRNFVKYLTFLHINLQVLQEVPGRFKHPKYHPNNVQKRNFNGE